MTKRSRTLHAVSVVLAGAVTYACAAREPVTAHVEAEGTADRTTASADATPRDASAQCTPNIGEKCTSDGDCAQCAMAARAFPRADRHPSFTVLAPAGVRCVSSVCKQTGCPVAECPTGTTCQGCVANLPCECR